MDITLAEVKLYCRIDGNAEDTLLQALIPAAKEYLAGAGVADPSGSSPRYALCVKAIVLDWYDRRGLTQRPDPHAVPGIRNLINQLKLEAAAERALSVTADAATPLPEGEASPGSPSGGADAAGG